MNKLTLALAVLSAALAGIAGTQWINTQNAAPALTQDQVREIVASMLDEELAGVEQSIAAQRLELDALQPTDDTLPEEPPLATATLDADTLNPMIEDYLMSDPRILQRVSQALQVELEREEMETARLALAALHDDIYNDPGHVVLGNPEGDVTLVEFYDYNCSYCRQSLPDIARLIEEDPNLRIIFKEFPVLSNDSLDAAKIAVAVAQRPDFDYWTFHADLFSGRGQVNAASATQAALAQGLDEDELRVAANSNETMEILQRNYALAQRLNITGTPAFIIGDAILPGAMGYDAIKTRIDNVRKCGSAVCDS